MRLSRFTIGFILLCSCVDEYDLPSVYSEAIVVQGMITDQPGPYVVQIIKTKAINDQSDSTRTVRGATD